MTDKLKIDRRSKNTPITKLIKLKSANPNLTTRQIGAIAGIDHTAVVRMFQRHNVDLHAIEEFKTNRADILAAHQERVLASITEDDLKKASARDKAIVFGTLYDKERLERGQSTSNQSMFFRVVEAACRPVDTGNDSDDSIIDGISDGICASNNSD